MTAPAVRDFQPVHPSRSATSPLGNTQDAEPFPDSSHLRPVHSNTTLGDGTSHPLNLPHSATNYLPSNIRRRPSHASTSAESVKRRPARSNTVRTYHAPRGPGAEPGAEPGIDTSQEEDVDISDKPFTECDITVIDFSQDKIEQYELDNASLKDFIDQPREDWASCRWICVNGLSWDVIKLLGNSKNLHRLAIEDLLSTNSRPKADWYSDHCFVVLTLQKLVRLLDQQKEDEYANEADRLADFNTLDQEDDDDSSTGTPYESQKTSHWLKSWISSSRKAGSRLKTAPPHYPDNSATEKALRLDGSAEPASRTRTAHSATSATGPAEHIRTLQRYRGSPNPERVEYMESRSALTPRNLAVSVEQVSIFLTSDNTALTFFEHSAADILRPIHARLRSPETILRRSCDASMLTQAVIDAIVDLAIPVAAAYDDAIAELELAVLTDPKISQPKDLYILTSEISLLRNFVEPIATLVHALRDHRADAMAAATPAPTGGPSPPVSGISITPLAQTYLSDVSDHIITLAASLDRMRASAENLTSLLFNTVSAHQNESIKQLTLVTIFFLPLTFLVGYFGQNFDRFSAVHAHSDAFFWEVAVPVMVVVGVWLSRGWVGRWVEGVVSRWGIRRRRRARRRRVA